MPLRLASDIFTSKAEEAEITSRTATKSEGWSRRLWLRWVLANVAGEMVGLGTTALLAAYALSTGATDLPTVLAMAAIVVVAGAVIEGTAVGTAQWLVLREPLTVLPWRAWTLATAAGAFVAWTLGMVPSTLANIGADAGGVPPAEMDSIATYGLAFVMGFLLGPVLGLPQWLVLRRYVRRAGWWVFANAVAWAPAMAIIFAGAGSVPPGGGGPVLVLVLLSTLAAAGAVVGAIHGLFLVWLLRQRYETA